MEVVNLQSTTSEIRGCLLLIVALFIDAKFEAFLSFDVLPAA
jgi:hypothetical protein